MEELKIRDFIYLDVDRLRSILSQIEKGYISELEKTNSSEQEVGVEIGGGLFNVLKASGNANFIWQKQERETRSLHDYIFKKTETQLFALQKIYNIDDNCTDCIREVLKVNDFVSCNGEVTIKDMNLLYDLFQNYHDIYSYIIDGDLMNSELTEEEKKKKKKQLLKETSESQIQGFLKYCNIFVKDRISIELKVYNQGEIIRLEGSLDRNFLRENINGIIYKYGSKPTNNWKMFAQIAAIPKVEEHSDDANQSGSSVNEIMDHFFQIYQTMEPYGMKITYPKIAVTPIAIYKD